MRASARDAESGLHRGPSLAADQRRRTGCPEGARTDRSDRRGRRRRHWARRCRALCRVFDHDEHLAGGGSGRRACSDRATDPAACARQRRRARAVGLAVRRPTGGPGRSRTSGRARSRSSEFFDGSMLPTRSNSSSAFCGVICVTTHAACSAARGVHISDAELGLLEPVRDRSRLTGGRSCRLGRESDEDDQGQHPRRSGSTAV